MHNGLVKLSVVAKVIVLAISLPLVCSCMRLQLVYQLSYFIIPLSVLANSERLIAEMSIIIFHNSIVCFKEFLQILMIEISIIIYTK